MHELPWMATREVICQWFSLVTTSLIGKSEAKKRRQINGMEQKLINPGESHGEFNHQILAQSEKQGLSAQRKTTNLWQNSLHFANDNFELVVGKLLHFDWNRTENFSQVTIINKPLFFGNKQLCEPMKAIVRRVWFTWLQCIELHNSE